MKVGLKTGGRGAGGGGGGGVRGHHTALLSTCEAPAGDKTSEQNAKRQALLNATGFALSKFESRFCKVEV